jgi:hypothetical protein
MKKIALIWVLVFMFFLVLSSKNASASYSPPSVNTDLNTDTEYICYFQSNNEGQIGSIIYVKADFIDTENGNVPAGINFHPDYGIKIGKMGKGSNIAGGGSYDYYVYANGTWVKNGFIGFATVDNSVSLDSQIACSVDLPASFDLSGGFSFQGSYYTYGQTIMSANYTPPSPYQFKLADTGQTKCYRDVAPWDEIPCEGTGQDGDYDINPLSYTDNGDGTVTDNNTGLIWQKEDDGKTYNWYQASGMYDATYNPTSQDVCKELGAEWRLPSKKELISIFDFSRLSGEPLINQIFTNTTPTFYWTSDFFVPSWGNIWRVEFGNGYVDSAPMDINLYVRCVCGKSLSLQNFVDHGDGTVTDINTGLMWQTGEEGGYKTWPQAVLYCENLRLPDNASGYTDWRLPNVKELESIIDDSRYDPAVDTTFFPSAYARGYWSSTTAANIPDNALGVAFYSGSITYRYKDEFGYDVRCVRGGQEESGGLELSPSFYNFGQIAKGTSSEYEQFTVRNTGTSNLWIYDIDVADTNNFDVDTNDNIISGCNPGIFGRILTPGGSCTFSVRFKPTTIGQIDSYITISSNDPDASGLFNISGTGTLPSYKLTVQTEGSGSGTVSSLDGTINCSSTCSQTYTEGTNISLNATANQGSIFNGWTDGGCSGTGSCVLNLNSDILVKANFIRVEGWSSETGYRSADTDIRKGIVASAKSMIGQPSGQSVICSMASNCWLTDVAGGDGARMRDAISIYDIWKRDNSTRKKTLDQIRKAMVIAFSGSNYKDPQKTKLVDRIIFLYDGGSTVVPTDDGRTLQYMGIRKQCLEWAMTTAINSGGTARNYQNTGSAVSKDNVRPGMGYYVYLIDKKTGNRVGGHAMIIIDTKYDSGGQLTHLKVAESNWGSGWSNPPGQIPWERIIRDPVREIPYGWTYSDYNNFVVVNYD